MLASAMDRVLRYLEAAAHDIALASGRIGAPVTLSPDVLDRSGDIALGAPGLRSANDACRMIRTRDGWIAVNLPRQSDMEAVPALLQADAHGDAWDMLACAAPLRASAAWIARAELLGLAVAQVGETAKPARSCETTLGAHTRPRGALRVADFSSLWAGPLCGSVFAAMGAEVLKLDTAERPDPTAQAAPQLDLRLNGAKQKKRVAIATDEGLAELHDDIAACDVLITSARARALGHLGLTPERLFAANPALVWVAVTGHGWRSSRIAFGDDAAAAGALVAQRAGEPHFLGDAIADPLTGLAAAAAALTAIEKGRGAFIDAALAQTAAFVAGQS